jgi:hypothetical protein
MIIPGGEATIEANCHTASIDRPLGAADFDE